MAVQAMETPIGHVTHYFNRLGVAVLALDDGLAVGEMIHITGHTTNFIQRVRSMEIDHRQVEMVGPHAQVALKVIERVRPGDVLYKVDERSGILVGFGLQVA